MASEYIKWKCRDVQPAEKKRELSPAEKRKNWWDYHKWHVLIGVLALLILLSLLHDMLGIGQIRPDYQLAYVGADPLPDDTVSALETALSEIGEDQNGDGQVIAAVNQYPTYENIIQTQNRTEEIKDGDLAMQAQASYVGLMTDLSNCDSFFFLLEDPETFQQTYEVISRFDGTLPEEENEEKQMYFAWHDSPLLAELDLGTYNLAGTTGNNQELLSSLYVARRGFWTEKTCENPEGCEALWIKLMPAEKHNIRREA